MTIRGQVLGKIVWGVLRQAIEAARIKNPNGFAITRAPNLQVAMDDLVKWVYMAAAAAKKGSSGEFGVGHQEKRLRGRQKPPEADQGPAAG